MTDIQELQDLIDEYIDIDEFTDFKSYRDKVDELFSVSDEMRKASVNNWNESIDEPEFEPEEFEEEELETFDDYVQEITEPLFEKIYSDIDKIMEEPLTKREQTVQVLETAKIPFTIKEFVEATGMNPNTARRELGQGVKKGLFKRVSRGTYEQLWDVKFVNWQQNMLENLHEIEKSVVHVGIKYAQNLEIL